MAGDKTYITDGNGKLHRATRTHKVTPESIVWSSNPNDYAVQVRIDGKWHRAFLTMDAGTATYFDNINIDKALVTGGDGKTHTCLICSPEATVTMSSIKTDQHSLVAGTTTGETAVNVYSENWSNVQWQDNVNVYKVLVTGSDGKVHTALLTTSVTGSVEVIIKGTSPLVLPDAIANSLSYVKAFGGTEHVAENYIDSVTVDGKCEQGLPSEYTAIEYVENTSGTYVDLGVAFNDEDSYMSVTADAVNDTNYIFCARDGNAMQGIAGTSSAFKAYIDPVSLTSTTTKTAGHKYNFTFTANNGNATFTTEDETATTGDTQTTVYTVSQTQPTAHLCLFGNTYGNVSGVGMKIYGATYTVAGVPVRKLVPARKGAQIGLFDLVSRQFFTATQGSLMAGQDTTIAPTPSAPLDIWCNNGVLKARRPSGLPLDYTLLDYIESTGTQYIDTGVSLQSNNVVYDFTIIDNEQVTNKSLFGSQSPFSGILNSLASTTEKRLFAGDSSSAPIGYTISENKKHHILTLNNGSAELKTDGVVMGTTTYSGTVVNNKNIYLFANNGGSISQYSSYKLFRFAIYDNNILVCNFIPAQQGTTVGLYDLVSGQFFTNQGTGDFVAGNPVSDPVEIYADGTTEVLTDNAGNTASVQNLLSVADYKDTQEILSGAVTRNVGVKVFDGTENWVWDNPLTGMFCNYSLNPEPTTDRSVLCNQFRTQSYVPTNRDGYCVKSSGGYIGIGYNALNGDSTAFKAWLAAQYANGTPVIVVYPLATAATETVAGQVLNKTPVTQTTGSVTTAITTTASDHSTPSPTQPLDINTNNGVLAFRDTELPVGYRRILGMTMNNNCYYEITGFKLNGSDTLRFSFTRTGANACNVLGAYDGTSAQTNYSLYVGVLSSTSYLRYNGGVYNSYAIADKKYDVVITPTGSDGMETDSTWTSKTFTSAGNLCVGTTSPSATSSKMVGSIHGTVVVDGRLELIPCERISDGEIGYYDTYTETFFEPIGTTPVSLGYDYSHYGIVTSGPVETINVHGKNLFDIATAQTLFRNGLVTETKTDTGYILENPNTSANFVIVNLGTVEALDGKSLVLSALFDTGACYFVYCDSDGSNRLYIGSTEITVSKTIADGRTNVALRFNADSSQGSIFTYDNIQVEQGSTATTYAPYYDGGTATAEMLLKVGDYQDQQEILSGAVTRNVGVKVLDGTEGWVRSEQSGFIYVDNLIQFSIGAPLCSHYLGTTSASASGSNKIRLAMSGSSYRTIIYASLSDYQTAESFKQYLADQYAAGTPVIVVYPLATPATESVTGQTLQVTDGDNILEITQAGMDGLELEAEYNAAVSLTVQEVQDANLDNNVTVTIQ